MFGLKFIRRLFGGDNSRFFARAQQLVKAINAHEPAIVALSDDALRHQTTLFKQRLANGEPLNALLPEAFATVREAAKRVLGQRHYDVQLLGGIALHEGKIAEMKTGEGKTLVAALPAYLNALTGLGVHIVTVNDYLAKRDATLMGDMHRFLGLSVGVVGGNMTSAEKRDAYNADITYGTNNEFGFDYLRDNLVLSADALTQRPHAYVIIDEVDSVLIDESRTPLIISGAAEDSSAWYMAANAVIGNLQPNHYDYDEKNKSVNLTEEGSVAIEEFLHKQNLLEGDLYDGNNIVLLHHLNQALRAHVCFRRDRDYIVRDDKVIIIDEFTGRMMHGRRYSEGLHQALEAKEGVPILPENRTLASITFQNYFRLYKKISGMTGTAVTEAREFSMTYGLEVVEMPTNRPLQRRDENDVIYTTEESKFKAVVAEIKEAHANGQPVLVGTASVEKSEILSAKLIDAGIAHNVLNARFHEREAEIIAQAGRLGAVTIATNMAGRGTDIQPGGNLEMRLHSEISPEATPEDYAAQYASIVAQIAHERAQVLAAGGLYVLGTERHESRRIDDQLRGRSGRQGDVGRSKFFLSFQDDLLRVFGNLDSLMRMVGMQDDQPVAHSWLNSTLRKAQQRVEAHHYNVRRQVLKYDDILNEQRSYVFALRRRILHASDTAPLLTDIIKQWVAHALDTHCPKKHYVEQWDLEALAESLLEVFAIAPNLEQMAEPQRGAQLRQTLPQWCQDTYNNMCAEADEPLRRDIERNIMLRTLDSLWQQHITTAEALMHSVGLRGYGQKDPLNEFRIEIFKLFDAMQWQLHSQTLRSLIYNWPAILAVGDEADYLTDDDSDEDDDQESNVAPTPMVTIDFTEDAADMAKLVAPQRNAPCVCGSGQRYKNCCGALNADDENMQKVAP